MIAVINVALQSITDAVSVLSRAILTALEPLGIFGGWIDSAVAEWCPDELLRLRLYAALLSLVGQVAFLIAAIWLLLAFVRAIAP